jgi:hypothetical protein
MGRARSTNGEKMNTCRILVGKPEGKKPLGILYVHTTRGYRQYIAIADLHTLQFTVTHALGF